MSSALKVRAGDMDPYKALGVGQNATDADIRQAFRKLAKELHPDLNPDNSAASEKFKRVSAAYELLSDPNKRKAFDRGEIDESGEPRHPFANHGMGAGAGGGFGSAYGARHRYGAGAGAGAGGPNFGFNDIFEDLFAGQRGGFTHGASPSRPPPRGADVRYTLEVEFLESVNGAKKRVTLPEGGVLDLAVPAGVFDGQTLRLRGKGGPCAGSGPNGDALVEIKVRPHPMFRREGADIVSEVPVTLDEAVLGGKVEVSTIDGRVQLSLPRGTNSGRVFRLKGKGVKKDASGKTGDHLVSIKIVMPDIVDDELAAFIETWRSSKSYDPGSR